MAAAVDDSKVVLPVIRPLFYLSAVQVSLPLLRVFGYELTIIAFRDVQHANILSEELELDKEIARVVRDRVVEYERVKKIVLSVPGHLRNHILETVTGLQYLVYRWQRQHHNCKLSEGEVLQLLRCDGTIDRIPAARLLVKNPSLDVQMRFRIACMYCLEQSIQSLWTEMGAFNEREQFEVGDDSMSRFWIRWMQEGAVVPWPQAAAEYLGTPGENVPMFCCFIPLLKPEDRERFLPFIIKSTTEDIRSCIDSLTKAEAEKVLKGNGLRLLIHYLAWPMQSLFGEAAEKVWSVEEARSVDQEFLKDFVSFISNFLLVDDFNYPEIFDCFFSRSPEFLREAVMEDTSLKAEMHSCFEKMRRRKEKEKEITSKTDMCHMNCWTRLGIYEDLT